ncbi:MAG: hypothetical protein V1889_03205 [archaeon]
MKKILVFLISFLVVAGVVGALSTTTSLDYTNDAYASLSMEHSVSGNSARLSAWNQGVGREGRVHIGLPSGFKLSDLESIDWKQYIENGYMAHVDVLLDINNDGVYDSGTDDALVFEYAKVDPNHCEESEYKDAGEGTQITTFGANWCRSE